MILQTIEELDGHLQRHPETNAILVLGDEEYLCRRALELVKRTVVSEDARAFDYSEFNAQESSAAEIAEAAGTFPMMSPRRLVVVSGLEKLSEGDESALLGILQSISRKTVILFSGSDLDRRRSFFKQLSAQVCVADFPKLKGSALERWAEGYVKKQGTQISSSAMKKIVDLAGSDLQSVANEIDKLILYAGKNKSVPDSAVELLLSASRQHGIFELTDAIGRRDPRRALVLLRNFLDSGEHPLVVVTMMARHFRQLLIAKDLLGKGGSPTEIRAAAQIPPFVLDEFLRQARSFDARMARGLYLKLAETDLRFKSSRADEGMVLEKLICML